MKESPWHGSQYNAIVYKREKTNIYIFVFVNCKVHLANSSKYTYILWTNLKVFT